MTKVVWVLNHLLSFSNWYHLSSFSNWCMRLGNHCTRIRNHNSRLKRRYTSMRNHHSRKRNHHSKKSDAATWKPNMTKVVWVPTHLLSFCNRCVRILITVRDYQLVFHEPASKYQSAVHILRWSNQMADHLSLDDVREFLISPSNTIGRTVTVYHVSDLVGLEICARRLDEHTGYLSLYRCHKVLQVIHHWEICLECW